MTMDYLIAENERLKTENEEMLGIIMKWWNQFCFHWHYKAKESRLPSIKASYALLLQRKLIDESGNWVTFDSGGEKLLTSPPAD